MEIPTPTLEEFRQLYEVAIAFRQDAPWEWMTEGQLFGVCNPETKQIGYASIMGVGGEHLALALYLGAEGLDGFWRMKQGEESDNPAFLLEIPQLQASFEDRNELHAQDRKVLKALGLKFRGRKKWPMFRSIVPGCLPWFVTSQEARFLTVALEQALNVSQRLKENRSLLAPLRESRYLIRTPTDQGWTDEWLIPAPPSVRPRPPVDKKRLATMRNQLPHQQFTLHVDLFVLPNPIKEKDDPRPYLPYTLMIVEARSEFIVGMDLIPPKPSLEAVWEQAPAKFLDIIARWGSLPTQIVVRSERVHNLLAPVAKGLDIKLKKSRRLPALDRARAAMEAWM